MIRKFFDSCDEALNFLLWWNVILTLGLAFIIGYKW